MRKVISYFIKYDVAVNVIILAFVVFGIVGASRMTSSFFPLVDSQIINININYPGAAPQEIEEGIVLKIEDNLKGLVGIERVTSVSRENGGSITVEIDQDEDIDVILTEVKNAVDGISSLPTAAERPIVSKQRSRAGAIMMEMVPVDGQDMDLMTLKEHSQRVEEDF